MRYAYKRLLSNLHLDWPLLGGISLISLLGLVVLYSAKPEVDFIQQQMVRLVIAGGVMVGMSHIPPRLFKTLAPWLYFAGLLLLASVLIMGQISKGGQRWLGLGFLRFQPAELMKIAVPMMVAHYLDERFLPPRLSTLWLPFVYILLPTLLVAKQPDLGTALLIASSGCLVLFLAGIAWRLIGATIVSILVSAPLLWYGLHDYQRQRILVLLDSERDPLGASYQIIQSKIAIGAGGLYGKGWLEGTQSHLEFLPERSTDFIFAVFAEEFGLIGCLILLLLYGSVIARGLYISVRAQDSFNRLLAGSLTLSIFVYVFVNIGMVTGILPVVGIPLPLVSYGGTSLVTLMASFGILMSIHTHRTLLPK